VQNSHESVDRYATRRGTFDTCTYNLYRSTNMHWKVVGQLFCTNASLLQAPVGVDGTPFVHRLPLRWRLATSACSTLLKVSIVSIEHILFARSCIRF
jgi:hypothetical protein